ncbi:MAG: two-component regulator propeller domain-containing protein, partial [Bacteroidia bacterium]
MLLNSNSRYLIVFLLYSLFGVSQQYYFKNYNSDNGLPFVQVYAMFQSQDGFLCTGGYGGISKFDGKQFSNITTSDGLSDNNVNCISEFDNGTLVVGSLKGISILERNLVLERDFLNVLKDVAINTIYKESDNELLIGTERGLYVLTPHAIRFIDGTRDLDVRAIVSRDSKIYFGGNFGLKVIDKGNVIAHEINDKLESKHINALCFDKSKSNLVIGTGNGLTILDVKNSNHYTFKISNGLIDNNINCLLSGSDSSIWIGTPSGLMKLKNNELKFFNIGMENNANIIRCLIEDFEGNIWIGTHSGIYRFRDEAFSSFDKLNGPGNAFIFEIFKANNALYLCSENRGVFKYSEGYFERFGHDKGIINNVCRSGAVDKNNNVYLESGNSVLQLKNGRLEKITISKQVKAPIYKIYCDSKNRLWIGGYNGLGLVNFDTKADTSFLPLPFYDENTSITDIFEDKYGRIWISAYKSGLYLYADGKIENILSRIKYEDNDIVSARADDKNVYVASLNGLLIVDINTFQTRLINSQFGLLSDIIYSIGFAKNKQKLWLGTNIGVSELDLQKYRKNGEISIISYTKDDGFIGVECNTNGIFEDTDGTVYFGTVSGLIKYLPNQFKSNKIEAKQIIYNMKLGDVDTILPDKVKLEYASNTISFYFRGIC